MAWLIYEKKTVLFIGSALWGGRWNAPTPGPPRQSPGWGIFSGRWISWERGGRPYCPREKYVRVDRRDNRPECASYNLAEAHLQSNLPPKSMECQLRQTFLCSWAWPPQIESLIQARILEWVGSHFFLQGIVPTQGSNLDTLHCRQILYCLSHQGSPWN